MSGDSEMIHLRNRCEPPSCLDITLFPLRTNGRACSVNITITYITQREPGSFCIIFFHKRRFPLIFHAMPVDLLSLSSSIATFIDGASKVRDAISKISENNRRLRRIKSDILRELDALEHFCCSRYSTWDGDTAQEVKAALNELQGDFRDIQALCEILLAARSGGILWSARLKSWFKRSTIEGEIRGLEQKIRSCQFRFMMFSSARTEYNTVINHQENRDRLGHIENLVSYMLLRNERSNSQPPFSSLNAAAPDEVDLNFLSYQIQKLVDGLDSVMTKWQRAVEPPSRDWTLTAGPGRIIDCVTFRKALLFSLHAWCVMSSSNGFTLQGLVIPIVELIGNVWATAVSNGVTQTTLQNSLKLAEFSIDACGALYSLDRCDQFEQMLAYTRHLASDFSNLLCDPRAFVFTEQAPSTITTQTFFAEINSRKLWIALAKPYCSCERRRSSPLTTAPRSPGMLQERPTWYFPLAGTFRKHLCSPYGTQSAFGIWQWTCPLLDDTLRRTSQEWTPSVVGKPSFARCLVHCSFQAVTTTGP
ncbi:hypothetical protein HGRIS_014919 [Hohenbuehelia grisea]|uniref:Fungal N-terminal domain-containing protein n=1 Tax=Hohenbuehelia grisea TaxID=104357 RepID=A0ABR3JF69_9AGAR